MVRSKVCALVALAVLGGAVRAARAAVLQVPQDLATIQAAVDAAANGDEIHVAEGTYAESIQWARKALALIGAGEDATILDPSLGPGGRCLRLIDVPARSLLAGFTCRNGRAASHAECRDVEANGGGLLLQGGSVAIERVTFDRNHSTGSGGGVWIDGADVTVADATFLDDEAFSYSCSEGGGLGATHGSRVAVLRSTFSGNSTDPVGGGIAIDQGSTATVVGSRFERNGGNKIGGGIWAADSDLAVSGCVFSRNETGVSGAAIGARDSTITVSDSTFDQNASVGRVYPAIAVSGELAIARSSITGNTGGGIRSYGDLTVTDCVFDHNHGPNGGAIDATGTAHVSRSAFVANVADGGNGHNDGDAFGGAILMRGDLTASSCVFRGNQALTMFPRRHFGGGAIYVASGSATVQDSVLRGDAPDEIGGPGKVTITGSDVMDNLAESPPPSGMASGTVLPEETADLAESRDGAPEETFARSFGVTGVVEAFARGGGGTMVVAGRAVQPQDIGTGLPVTPSTNWASAFVLGFGPEGEPRYSAFFPNAAFGAVAVDDAGDTLVTGGSPGGATFGEITEGAAGGFLVRLDPAGRVRWVQSLPGVSGNAIAVDVSGDLFLGGTFRDDTMLGRDRLWGAHNVFLARLRPSGEVTWARSYPGEIPQRLQQIAIDAAGRVVIAGTFSDHVQLGRSKLVSNGGTDVFLAAVGGDGEVAWARGYGGPGDDDAPYLAIAPDDSVVVAATLRGELDPGSGPIRGYPGREVYVASFAPDGSPRWAVPFAVDDNPSVTAVAVGPGGDIFVAGTSAVFRPYPRPFLAQLDGDGHLLKLTLFPTQGSASIRGLLIDPSGTALVAGSFRKSMALGGTILRGPLPDDLFLARIAP